MRRRQLLLGLGATVTTGALYGCNEFSAGYDEKDMPREGAIRWPEGRPRTALVLGSGGPRGFAHVGVLKALEAHAIEPALIVGSSAGAMVGALYAAQIPAARIEALALSLGVLDIADPAFLRPNRFMGRALQDTINEQVRVARIENLPRRFTAIAASIEPRALVAFSQGNVGAAVRASCALPDYFLPTTIGDVQYEDGDMLSPVPIAMAQRLGATRIVAVDVSAWKEDEPEQARESWRARDAERRAMIDKEAAGADLLLRVRLPYYAGMSRAYRENVIALGEQQTLMAIGRLRALLANQ